MHHLQLAQAAGQVSPESGQHCNHRPATRSKATTMLRHQQPEQRQHDNPDQQQHQTWPVPAATTRHLTLMAALVAGVTACSPTQPTGPTSAAPTPTTAAPAPTTPANKPVAARPASPPTTPAAPQRARPDPSQVSAASRRPARKAPQPEHNTHGPNGRRSPATWKHLHHQADLHQPTSPIARNTQNSTATPSASPSSGTALVSPGHGPELRGATSRRAGTSGSRSGRVAPSTAGAPRWIAPLVHPVRRVDGRRRCRRGALRPWPEPLSQVRSTAAMSASSAALAAVGDISGCVCEGASRPRWARDELYAPTEKEQHA